MISRGRVLGIVFVSTCDWQREREDSQCSISDTRRYKSVDLAAATTSLASPSDQPASRLSSPPPSPWQPSPSTSPPTSASTWRPAIGCQSSLHRKLEVDQLDYHVTSNPLEAVADCLVKMWVIDEMKQSVRHPGGERGRRGGRRRAPRRRGMWSSVYTKYN